MTPMCFGEEGEELPSPESIAVAVCSLISHARALTIFATLRLPPSSADARVLPPPPPSLLRFRSEEKIWRGGGGGGALEPECQSRAGDIERAGLGWRRPLRVAPPVLPRSRGTEGTRSLPL